MKVLVTGANGFIGRHLVPALQAEGHGLRLALRDRRSANRMPASALEACEMAYVGEIGPSTDWGEALRGIEAVVHLAARAHVFDAGADDEVAFWSTNVEGTERLAQQAVAAGVRRFLLMSSVGAVATFSETAIDMNTPSRPDAPYGRSKLGAEEALKAAAGEGMSWTILRPTLVYGRGCPGNMRRLVALVQRGLPLPFAAVRNRRSFVYVGNLVEAIVRALVHPAAASETFLVSDGQDLSTPELLRKIAEHSDRRPRLVPIPEPWLLGAAKALSYVSTRTRVSLPIDGGSIQRICGSLFVDSSPIRRALEWQPAYGVDEGLREMLEEPL
jgi:nucleoside-diphosphate-sugar epimerase